MKEIIEKNHSTMLSEEAIETILQANQKELTSNLGKTIDDLLTSGQNMFNFNLCIDTDNENDYLIYPSDYQIIAAIDPLLDQALAQQQQAANNSNADKIKIEAARVIAHLDLTGQIETYPQPENVQHLSSVKEYFKQLLKQADDLFIQCKENGLTLAAGLIRLYQQDFLARQRIFLQDHEPIKNGGLSQLRLYYLAQANEHFWILFQNETYPKHIIAQCIFETLDEQHDIYIAIKNIHEKINCEKILTTFLHENFDNLLQNNDIFFITEGLNVREKVLFNYQIDNQKILAKYSHGSIDELLILAGTDFPGFKHPIYGDKKTPLYNSHGEQIRRLHTIADAIKNKLQCEMKAVTSNNVTVDTLKIDAIFYIARLQLAGMVYNPLMPENQRELQTITDYFWELFDETDALAKQCEENGLLLAAALIRLYQQDFLARQRIFLQDHEPIKNAGLSQLRLHYLTQTIERFQLLFQTETHPKHIIASGLCEAYFIAAQLYENNALKSIECFIAIATLLNQGHRWLEKNSFVLRSHSAAALTIEEIYIVIIQHYHTKTNYLESLHWLNNFSLTQLRWENPEPQQKTITYQKLKDLFFTTVFQCQSKNIIHFPYYNILNNYSIALENLPSIITQIIETHKNYQADSKPDFYQIHTWLTFLWTLKKDSQHLMPASTYTGPLSSPNKCAIHIKEMCEQLRDKCMTIPQNRPIAALTELAFSKIGVVEKLSELEQENEGLKKQVYNLEKELVESKIKSGQQEERIANLEALLQQVLQNQAATTSTQEREKSPDHSQKRPGSPTGSSSSMFKKLKLGGSEEQPSTQKLESTRALHKQYP